MMESNKEKGWVAEPAVEEIKKHGDQLKTQVEEAAGKKPDGGTPAQESRERSGEPRGS